MKIFPVALTPTELVPVAINDRRALLWERGDHAPALGDTLKLEAAGGKSCHRVVTDVQEEAHGLVVSFRPLTKIEKEALK